MVRAPPKKSFEPRNLNIMKFVLNISKQADAGPNYLAEMRGYRKERLNTKFYSISIVDLFSPREGLVVNSPHGPDRRNGRL